MKRVTIHEAKTHLSRLLLAVTSGEKVIVSRGGKPIAQIIPFGKKQKFRQPGKYLGKIKVRNDFDKPLPQKILRYFVK